MTREHALDDLKQSLRDLLALLDGDAPHAEALLRAVAECDARVVTLQEQAAPVNAGSEEQATFRHSMEEALRLNAVARSVVESQGAQLVAQLEKARGLRKGLAGTSSQSGNAGRSVDVAG